MSRSSSTRRVLHLIRNYLLRTETFIYSQVLETPGYRSYVMARNPLEKGAERCPLPDLSIYARDRSPSPAGLWANANYGLLKRMTRHELDFYLARIGKIDPDLLHIHYGPDARYFLPVLQQISQPAVVSFYGFDASSFPRRLWGFGAFYLRPMFRRVQRVLAMSEDMKSDLIRIGCPTGKIRILYPNGVNLDVFSSFQRPAPVGRKAVILNIAALEERKGQQDLIKAFGRVLRRFPNAELRIAGEGPLRSRIEKSIRALGVGDHVRLLGHLPYEKLPEELGRADIFCHPSVTSAAGDKEGIPTIILEAASTGLPVVATRHAGIPEAVVEGRTGFLVQERDPSALAERILQLLGDSSLCRRMGEDGRDHIRDHFELGKLSGKRRAVYDDLLAAGK
jgi:colanic acid/amylovoran biosynthesis glycosyltransferase